MGRKKAFNVEKALKQATEVFWDRGYEGASLSDLTDRMQIQRASLYDTFESKEELYWRALTDYQRSGEQAILAIVESEARPLDKLRSILQTSFPDCDSRGPGARKGCFCVNSSINVAPHQPRVASSIREHNQRVIRHIARVIAAGQAEGTIRLDCSPIELGEYVLTALFGLHVQAKTVASTQPLSTTLEIALKGLQP